MRLPKIRFPKIRLRLRFPSVSRLTVWFLWLPRRPQSWIGRYARNPFNIAILILIVIIVVSGLVWFKQRSGNDPNGFRLVSPALKDGAALPAQFTCDGDNINPEFSIANIPPKTKSLAIIMEDKNLDKKSFKDYPYLAHWMVWNIPVSTAKITQGIRPPGTIGRNLFGNFAYGGPCPPEGKTHHYIFTLYALNVENINKTSDNGLADVKNAIRRHDIAKSELKVIYTRLKK